MKKEEEVMDIHEKGGRGNGLSLKRRRR